MRGVSKVFGQQHFNAISALVFRLNCRSKLAAVAQREQKESSTQFSFPIGFCVAGEPAESCAYFSAVFVVVRQPATNLLIYVKKFSKF